MYKKYYAQNIYIYRSFIWEHYFADGMLLLWMSGSLLGFLWHYAGKGRGECQNMFYFIKISNLPVLDRKANRRYFVFLFFQSPSLKVFSLFIGLILYIFEVGTDVLLAYGYYISGDILWFALTLTIALLAGVSMSTWSMMDWWHSLKNNYRNKCFSNTLRLTSTIFLVTPISLWVYLYIYLSC